MSVEVERATLPCGVCGAGVTELRRGRCWGCYMRWAESRPVGRGAACTVCGEKRRAQLKLVELQGRSLPFCHGCAAKVMRLPEVPVTVRSSARRCAAIGGMTTDVAREGRSTNLSPRAAGGRAARPDAGRLRRHRSAIKLADVNLDDAIIELGDADLAEGDQTQVRPNPAGTASLSAPDPSAER